MKRWLRRLFAGAGLERIEDAVAQLDRDRATDRDSIRAAIDGAESRLSTAIDELRAQVAGLAGEVGKTREVAQARAEDAERRVAELADQTAHLIDELGDARKEVRRLRREAGEPS